MHRQRVISASPGGNANGYIRGGEFFVESRKYDDGSLIQSTPDARRSIETMLKKQGYDAPFREEALARLDNAAENTRVKLTSGLEAVKWQVTGITLDLDGPHMDPVVPIKIAYEFAALQLGTAICENIPPLNAIRLALNSGNIDSAQLSVERLLAPQALPLHGIIFEGNHPHARIQIRFFGKLAFRVHFYKLAAGGPRWKYTHDMARNEEEIQEVRNVDEKVPK